MFVKSFRIKVPCNSHGNIPTHKMTVAPPHPAVRRFSIVGYGSNSQTMPMTNKGFDEKKPKEKLPTEKLGTDGVYMEGMPNTELNEPLEPRPKPASSLKDEKLTPEEMRTHYRGTGAGPDAQDGGLRPSHLGKSPSKAFQNAVDDSYNANHN